MLSRSTTPEPDATPPLQVGDTLGPYVLERLLGEGTMGRVYQGRHQRLGRQVALKVLHGHLIQDKTLVARFLQEARLVNQINHPHIVEVHDFVEDLFPERVYGVMELLRGQDAGRAAGRAGAHARRAVRASASRSPTRCTPRTGSTWCTATSSPTTSSSPRARAGRTR